MPLVYVGRVNKFFGRPLWEIVFNLKDFGAGRIVTRSTYSRYPEVTYYRIVKVEPTVIEYPQTLYGKILVEKTFRGIKSDELYDLGRVAFKPDFALIPKNEEEAFIKSGTEPVKNTEIYPSHVPFPPLWQELIKRDKAREGVPVKEEDLLAKVVYKHTNTFKVAEKGEKPTFEFSEFRPRHPHLYKAITVDKEKQKAVSKSS